MTSSSSNQYRVQKNIWKSIAYIFEKSFLIINSVRNGNFFFFFFLSLSIILISVDDMNKYFFCCFLGSIKRVILGWLGEKNIVFFFLNNIILDDIDYISFSSY